jgi:small ligand-binding sensory domain FIST
MKWTSALSRASTLEAAVGEVAKVLKKAHPKGVDLAVVFVSPQHALSYQRLPALLHEALSIGELIGCSGGGIVGGGHEVENGPALSVTVASLPEVGVRGFALDAEAIQALAARPTSWRELLELEPEHEPMFVLLPNPFSCPVDKLVNSLDAAYPDSPKVGGLASGGQDAASTGLFLRQGREEAGVVGIALWGDVYMDTAVAQGCRPIGVPFILTHCHRNLAIQLDGEPAIQALDKVYGSLSEKDRVRFRNSPHVGISLHAGKQPYRQGDYLLRNVLGVDREKGAVAMGAHLEVGMEVRFHIRDADTSTLDLDAVLDRAAQRGKGASGALLFSCLGRGENLYGATGHDSGVFKQYFGDAALGGFFCNGEIGPVQGRTYLHGYTSSFGIFRAKGWS